MRCTIFAPLVLAVSFLGCPKTTTSPTFIVVPDSNLCPAMCEHFRVLKCAEGDDYYDNDKPGPKGVPNSKCEAFCIEQQNKGVYENPRCLMQVPSCKLIEDWRKKDCTPEGGL